MSGAEITKDVFLGIAALLSSDYHHFMGPERGKSPDNGPIFRKQPIPVQFRKIRESQLKIIERERPFWMPSDFDPVPGTEIGKNLAFGFLQLFFHQGDLFLEADAQRMGFRMLLQLLKLGLHLSN